MTDYVQRKICMIRFNRREFLGTTVAGIAAASQRGLPLQANEPVPPTKHLPTIPYGAVYFRKSNPPKEDWERDYKQAAADGMNCFRHWFLWSAIEVAPGKYDWDDYDRQLDLAAKYGIKTIVADILCTAPQWAFKEYPHAWIEEADGTRTGEPLHGGVLRWRLAGVVPGQERSSCTCRAVLACVSHALSRSLGDGRLRCLE